MASPVLHRHLVATDRVQSVDLWRGVVMVIMGLDHVRDFFLIDLPYRPTDVEQTHPALFFTRWVTHLCAPSFFFLAGVGIFFAAQRRSGNELTRYLVTRGLALIAIEWTLVYWAWSSPARIWPAPTLLVIWALGMSMVVNGFLLRLPYGWIAVISGAMIVGHNLLDRVSLPSSQIAAAIFGVLHRPGFYPITGLPTARGGIGVLYPLIPWIGVMSAGFIFGRLYSKKSPAQRQRLMAAAGAAALLLFAFLRITNLYGNPQAQTESSSSGTFAVQSTFSKTALAFLNVEKYPPSFQFLLVTLGLSLIALALIDRAGGKSPKGLVDRIGRMFIVFGKVPLFYYVVHLYLIHALAIVAAVAYRQPVDWLLTSGMFGRIPQEYGFGLPFVYAMWFVCIALLYLPCRWYMHLKATHRYRWLSYF